MNFFKTLLMTVLFAFASIAAAAGTININTASAEQLTELNGVGDVKAKTIVAYRNEHGAFKSIDQLADVKGIGLKTVEKNRELMSVGNAKTANPKAP